MERSSTAGCRCSALREVPARLCPIHGEAAKQDAATSTDEQPQPQPVCENCGGDGWYLDHEDECYETGDCNCSGVQVECDVCA